MNEVHRGVLEVKSVMKMLPSVLADCILGLVVR